MKITKAQKQLLKTVALFNKEHPNWLYCPTDLEWRSAICLYKPGLLEPVDCGKKEHRFHHGRGEYAYESRTWVSDIRVKLTEKGLVYLESIQ